MAKKGKDREPMLFDQGMVEADMVRVLEKPDVYPVVDAHVHMTPEAKSYEYAIRAMDAAGIAVTVNLSGGLGATLAKHLRLAKKYPGRFIQFCRVDAAKADWKARDVGARFARTIQQSHDMGAAGFGEIAGWDHRRYIDWDDERLEPMWAKAEELRMPVNWHVSQPSRFWRPVGPLNMLERPSEYGKKRPLKFELLMQQERVLERHPRMTVIAAHANYLVDMVPLMLYRMEKYRNYHIELSASMEEWGRATDDFQFVCSEYRDRILYGTDVFYTADAVKKEGGMEKAVAHVKAFHLAHFLFLGTRQRTIPCPFSGNYGSQIVGWKGAYPRYASDGVNLQPDILKRIYYGTADRLLGTKARAWKGVKRVDLSSAT